MHAVGCNMQGPKAAYAKYQRIQGLLPDFGACIDLGTRVQAQLVGVPFDALHGDRVARGGPVRRRVRARARLG